MSEARTPMQVKRELKARVKELKPLLPRGTAQEVATKFNLSDTYVYDVMASRRWDLNVIESLISVGEKNLKRALAAEEKLGKILDKSKAPK